MSTDSQPRGKSPQRYLQDEDGGLVQRPRIADDVWYPALEKAKAEGYAIGHIISDLLDGWLAGDYVIEDDDEETP
jgi:hypothetical protein